jgi:hypothetical protein
MPLKREDSQAFAPIAVLRRARPLYHRGDTFRYGETPVTHRF